MGIYTEATEKGVCWACQGKKGHWREEDVNGGGQIEPRHYRPCTYCNDTGRPGEEQLAKAQLEKMELCTDCEFELNLHRGQRSPHGCMFALRTIVKELRKKVEDR